MRYSRTCLQFLVLGLCSSLFSVNAGVTPSYVGPVLAPGEWVEIEKAVTLPDLPPKLDVCLLVDLSGSYYDDLPNIKTQMPAVFDAVKADIDDVRFCLASFVDFPFEPWGWEGDYAYGLDQNLTADKTTWMAAVNAMATRNGYDEPESQYEALIELATGAGNDVPPTGPSLGDIPPGLIPNWRDDATKVVIITTDASFHESGDSGPFPYPGPTAVDAINALMDAGIKVISLKAPGSTSQMDDLAFATGGSVQTTSNTSHDIADAILAAFVGLTFDVTGTPEGCDPLEISLNPFAHLDILGGETVYFDETILVPDDASYINNPYCCKVIFTAGDTPIGTQEVCATVRREVLIDIRPGSFRNIISLRRTKGIVPVAILGSEVFNVEDIDRSTMKFGHDCINQVPVHFPGHPRDVNEDGFMDLISHYVIGGTGIVSGDTMACMSGKTNDGIDFIGYDSLRTRH